MTLRRCHVAKATVAKGPSKIPQDVQRNIIKLAVLLKRLTEASDAYDRKKDQIAERLMDGITVIEVQA
jgi:hypothetical protein